MSKSDPVMDFIETLEELRRYRHWFFQHSSPVRHNAMMLLIVLHYHFPEDGLGIQPSELGKLLKMTRPTITSLVNSLEEQGLVERMNDDEDRRVVFVRPTEQGTLLMKRVKSQFASCIAEMMAYLGKEDGEELVRIMRRVGKFLDEQQENSDGSQGSCGD